MPWAVARRRVEDRLVRHTGVYGALHGVVDLQDQAFGAVLPVLCLILTAHDRERVQNVICISA